MPSAGPSLRLAAGPSLTHLWQEVERGDRSIVEAAGYPGTAHYRALAPGVTGEAAFRVPLGVALWAEALVGGTAAALPTRRDQNVTYLEGHAGVGAGASF
ncbi:MAG TPA: hypothetical protein VFS43_41190 [Polyangiaceae bacterium]|nr:hypothetical protein [Polyangiaceae bacterium]